MHKLVLYPGKEFKTAQPDIKKPAALGNLFNTSIILCKTQTQQATSCSSVPIITASRCKNCQTALYWSNEDKINMNLKVGAKPEFKSLTKN